jgi:hypothetical protein
MVGGLGGVDPDRPLDALDGELGLALLELDHAREVQRVGLILADGENLVVDVVGGRKPPGAVMLEGYLQIVFDGDDRRAPFKPPSAA